LSAGFFYGSLKGSA